MTSIASTSWIGLALLALSVAGCQQAQVAHPLTAELSGNDPQAQLEFWHTLSSRPVTSNDEAFHGLLLYVDSQDAAGDYAQRVQALKSRKMLPTDFAAPANQAVQRGTLAVAVCRVLQVRGGVMLHIVPQSPRYAVRELQFAEVFPPSSPQQTFSGSEFLGIIGRLEDYQRGSTIELPATVMPGEKAPPATRPTR
jgi:hypothetical protein